MLETSIKDILTLQPIHIDDDDGHDTLSAVVGLRSILVPVWDDIAWKIVTSPRRRRTYNALRDVMARILELRLPEWILRIADKKVSDNKTGRFRHRVLLHVKGELSKTSLTSIRGVLREANYSGVRFRGVRCIRWVGDIDYEPDLVSDAEEDDEMDVEEEGDRGESSNGKGADSGSVDFLTMYVCVC